METEIHAVIKDYVAGMMESSKAHIEKAFHEKAKVTGYLGPDFLELSRTDFAEYCAAQQPSPKANGVKEFYEVVSLDISGETAVAKVKDNYLGHMFLDTLTFVRSEGKWSIYNKLFVVTGEA